MAYADFDIAAVEKKFGTTSVTMRLFTDVLPLNPPSWLTDHFKRIIDLPLSNEKVRSELFVSPLLLAIRELEDNNLGMYSGVRFDVDPQNRLVGECDFILGLTPSITLVRAPIVTMVVAKKADLDLGIGQCMAQMIASQKFNLLHETSLPIFGCVSNGKEWQFLKLEETTFRFSSYQCTYHRASTATRHLPPNDRRGTRGMG